MGHGRDGGPGSESPGSYSRRIDWAPPPASVAIDYSVADGYSRVVKDIAFSRGAVRALTRMPRNHAQRIREKIAAFANDPASQANNVRRLRGAGGLLRLRVGDWRVIMRGERLEILHVTTRGSAYTE